jgi:starch synthase (maltosyl-transferring)
MIMKESKTPRALDILAKTLAAKHKETIRKKSSYYVPSVWVSETKTAKAVKVNPYEFYLEVVEKARKAKTKPRPDGTGGGWSKDAIVYNMFVRTTLAFDHDQNGKLDLPVNSQGFRDTGTFLKAMALLPYIKGLGATAVHLLPITSIGHDGNKGDLGSPYAIRNPYELDESLSEPSLGLDAKTEFKAFVEAAHAIGLRVVVEFVFRTAAKDGDWVKEHPEWFYWIKDDILPRDPSHNDESRYGSPLFSHEELGRIHHDVNSGRFDNLVPPHTVYRDFFTLPPRPENVNKEGMRYVGVLGDGTRVRIPGAFADWPPDDNQPPWNDVTYLRMYTNPDFNYIAYNTIRMYDSRLTQHQFINRPLWDRIIGIVPYYQREFHIDGVMIDMGHALPKELKAEMVRAARGNDHDFAFWDENFAIEWRSKEEGYNAVMGYLWHIQHEINYMKEFTGRLSHESLPLPFFATAENHNTPRAAARKGGVTYARWTLVVNAFLPAVPFIHSGFELAEQFPINTGLDFTVEDQRRMPSETLPLFSAAGYNWLTKERFSEFVAEVLALRERYHDLIVDGRRETFRVLNVNNWNILAYARVPVDSGKRLAVVTNGNMAGQEEVVVQLDTGKKHIVDLLSEKRVDVTEGHMKVLLKPGQCLVFEY